MNEVLRLLTIGFRHLIKKSQNNQFNTNQSFNYLWKVKFSF